MTVKLATFSISTTDSLQVTCEPEDTRHACNGAQRNEEAELALAIDRAAHTGIVDPNTAPRDQLMTLHGIGETLALRMIENRPYRDRNDLLKVKGFGEATLRKFEHRLPKPFRSTSP